MHVKSGGVSQARTALGISENQIFVSLFMYGAYYDLFITAEQPAAKLTAARG